MYIKYKDSTKKEFVIAEEHSAEDSPPVKVCKAIVSFHRNKSYLV